MNGSNDGQRLLSHACRLQHVLVWGTNNGELETARAQCPIHLKLGVEEHEKKSENLKRACERRGTQKVEPSSKQTNTSTTYRKI